MPTFDAISTVVDQAGSQSFNHTVASQSNRLLIVWILWYGAQPDGISVSYNSVSMTELSNFDIDSLARMKFYKLVAPDTGTHSVSITDVSGFRYSAYAASFYDVDQTAPTGTVATAKDTLQGNSPITVDVSSASGELVLDGVWAKGGAITVDASQTERWNSGTHGSDPDANGASTEAGASTVTMSWTFSGNLLWATMAVPIKPASASPNTPSVNDTATVAEAQKLSVPMPPNVFNSIAIDELARLYWPITASVNEAITIVDAQALSGLTVPPGPQPNINDAITVSESSAASLLTDDPFRQAVVANGSQVTFSMATRKNNALAVFVRWGSATITLDSVSDTHGNAYTLVRNPVTIGSGVRAAAAVAIDQVGGDAPTIFANFSSTPSAIWMAAHEVTQRDLLAPVDGSAGQAQSLPVGTDAVSSGPFTTTRDGAYIFGGSTEAGSSAVTDPGTGFLERTRDFPVSVGFITEDKVQTTAGSTSATFTGESPGIAYATIGLALQYARFWLPNLADSISIADAASVAVPLMPVLSETITVTEFLTLQEKPGQAQVFDAVTLTESVFINIASFPGLSVSVFDLVLLESQPAPRIVAVETLAVSDLVLVTRTGIIAADNVTITDGLTVQVTFYIKVFDQVLLVLMPESWDTVTVTESTTITFATFGARQITTADAAIVITELATIRFSRLPANVNESVAVTESPLTPLRINPLHPAVNEATTLTDQITVVLRTNVNASLSDAVAVTESTLLTLVGPALVAITTSDSLTVSEFVMLAVNIVGVFDAVTVTENVIVTRSTTAQVPITVGDDIVVADATALTFQTNPIATVFDVMAVAEGVTIAVRQLPIAVTDAVTITDSASLGVPALGLTSSDAVSLTESVIGALSFLQVQSFEDVSVGEGRNLAENPLRFSVAELVTVEGDGTTLVGPRIGSPRIRGMFAWERWIRRDS